MKHTLSILSFLFLLFTATAQPNATAAAARPGTLDETFGEGGKVLLSDITDISSMALQKDGKIVVTAYSNRVVHNNAVIRFNQDGTLDTSFGNSGFVGIDFRIYSVAVQDDGKIIAGGFRDDYMGGDNYNIYLARLLPDGSLDNSFGEKGYVHDDFGNQEFCYDVQIQPDGKIVAAGTWEIEFPAFGDFIIVRYMADGSVDSSFGDKGKTITDFGRGEGIATIAIQRDNKIVASGGFYDPGYPTNTKCAFTRYLPDGTLDSTFGDKGQKLINITSSGDAIYEIAALEDGTILGGGYAGQNIFGEKRSLLLLSLNADGSLNKNFGDNGEVITNFDGQTSGANAIAVQNDGKIIAVGGWSAIGDTVGSFIVARFLSDGSSDSAFGINGKQTTSFGIYSEAANAVAIQKDDKIITAGEVSNSSISYLALARYNGDPLSRITRIKRWIKHHVLNFQDLQANNNTDYYSIERSSNGSSGFTEVARIASSQNSKLKSKNTYSYQLPQTSNIQLPTSNEQYYRIKAVDKDGSVACSDVIADQQTNQYINQSTIQLYPNPVKDVLHISGLNASSNTSLSILNEQGNLLRSMNVSADTYDLNVSQLKQGTYYLMVETNGKVNTQKFLKE